jgi:hypothetical protein
MKVRLSVLRRLIREAIGGPLGWPTDKTEHVYGVPDRLADKQPAELGNLRLPKGPNSRDNADDRDLDDQVPDPGAHSYGKRRGVSTSNKSNNDNGRGGGGGG